MKQFTFKAEYSNRYYIINAECIEQAYSVLYFTFGMWPSSVTLDTSLDNVSFADYCKE